ncbi:MAG: glutathione S-transferase family protein [Burkholderiaceae bacterium]
MKLYSNPLSPNCRKVHALVKNLGLQVEVETVNLRTGAQKQAAYLAINPNGKVPALVDGSKKIWESNAILAYLAGRQDTPLWPKSDDRYEIMKWMSWESCHFAPAVAKIIGQVIFAPMRGAQPDQAVIQQGLEDFRKCSAVANGQLEATKFLIGDKASIADFAVAVWLSYEKTCSLPVAEFTHLSRWWKAMQDAPGGAEFAAPKA